MKVINADMYLFLEGRREEAWGPARRRFLAGGREKDHVAGATLDSCPHAPASTGCTWGAEEVRRISQLASYCVPWWRTPTAAQQGCPACRCPSRATNRAHFTPGRTLGSLADVADNRASRYDSDQVRRVREWLRRWPSDREGLEGGGAAVHEGAPRTPSGPVCRTCFPSTPGVQHWQQLLVTGQFGRSSLALGRTL